jgi:type II secretory pathway component PulJ
MSMRLFTSGNESGFTLVEVVVAVFAGIIIVAAAFSIVDVSLHQSSRIADRASADQRARLAMENIVLDLHTSCVAPKVTPVEPKSEANKLLIISQTGAESSFAKVELHEIALVEEKEKGKYKLIEATYPSTKAKPAPEWEFSKVATETQTLVTKASQSFRENAKKEKEAIPFFQYFKYEGSKLSETPLKTPLGENEANETAAITVSFTTAPETGNEAGHRTVDLADTVVLRFSPASPSGNNLPCA